MLALLQRVEMCCSKDSLLSISMPRSFTLFSELIARSLIFNGQESFILAFFLTKMAWNLSGLTIISFYLKHSIAAWLSVSSVEIRFSIVLSGTLIVLSSAKFNRSFFIIQRYRSFINILKRIGPSTEPWELQIKVPEIRYEYC